MMVAGVLGAILLGLFSEGALGSSSSAGGGGLLGDAAFRRNDHLSPERPGPPPAGWDMYRADGPLPRRERGAGGVPPDWHSAASWWMTSGPERLELSESCRQLLQEFGRSGAALIVCVARNAWPMRICEECIPQFSNFKEAFSNISKSSGNVSCSKQLLELDQKQIVLNMYNCLEKIWTTSMCDACLNSNRTAPSMDTIIFMKMHNDSLNCFHHYSSKHQDHGNRSDLCTKCKASYNNLTEWYNKMTRCIDIIDAMNMTQRLWSKTYNCTVPCSDTVPVIAVSTFLLFLPVIFYLSSYLHSEQKKMKLMEPKRLKHCSSAARVEDRPS
ncbi:osteopetrosis-associated transmembrane protein 1 [Mustelus asterias]